ncbi:MAG: DNA polymerase III subunit gamma/tau [Candidatus Eisenbacteria bacterium]|uniref:DNA polymerase III subunit gamma/tau n=1 Tax=Eiseniibacteriota bacterium TaxID=2212470 RepID=A0A956SGU6_UNCEI|nr:DNA polymerase III subunit gamma/tau [Candidatus Eisenbacteria bacterium]MCB9463088.1 DNA polymerase III subunit gamma/tau [Candidatus Eisenbacteria bacterium]
MSYRVLALKWRPQRFEDVAGQAHVSRTLSNALRSGRTAHAYLFTGPRGVGKTSTARILAKALNCERELDDRPCGECPACQEITDGRALDVIEIDGASNRGIDDIRELREAVRYTPARLRSKVYIIDEVHMLTQDAFNALLKTLEEPPPHVVFVLATTEVLKVPQTILSRCQRFDFARLRGAEATARMEQICESEGIETERDALALIALKGDGSMRDALTLLDQVAASGIRPLTADVVRDALGIAGRELFFEWTDAILAGDASQALSSFARAVDHGSNLQELAEEFLVHLRNIMVVATEPTLLEQVEGTDEERARYGDAASKFEVADILRFCRLQMDSVQQMRRSAFPRVHQEIALAEMCALPRSLDLRKFVSVARSKFGEGAPVPKAPATQARRS